MHAMKGDKTVKISKLSAVCNRFQKSIVNDGFVRVKPEGRSKDHSCWNIFFTGAT